MINISSAMAGQFAESASEISERIKELGPNPLKNDRHPE
jgi:coenzyme F420-reducing hydrogenase delta subunit